MSGSEGALMFSFWIKHSALIAAEKLLTPSLTVSPWDCNYDVQKQSSRQHKLLWYCDNLLFPVQGCCCCNSASANWAILGRIHPVPRAHRSQGPHEAKSGMSLVMQVLHFPRPLLSFAQSWMRFVQQQIFPVSGGQCWICFLHSFGVHHGPGTVSSVYLLGRVILAAVI